MNAPQPLLEDCAESVKPHIALAQQVMSELGLSLAGPPEIQPCYWPDEEEPEDNDPHTCEPASGTILFLNIAGNMETLLAANRALAMKELENKIAKDGQFSIVFTAS